MRCVTTRFIPASDGVMCCHGVCGDRSEEVTSTPVQERGNKLHSQRLGGRELRYASVGLFLHLPEARLFI